MNNWRSKLGNKSIVNQILGKSLLAFGIKVVSAGLSFLMFVLIARVLGQVEYGNFGVIFSLATLIAVIGSVGHRSLVLKYASRYESDKNIAFQAGIFRRGYVVVVLGTILISILLIPVYYNAEGKSLVWVSCVAILALGIALAEFQAVAFRCGGSVKLALVPRDILWRALVCILAAFAMTSVSLPLLSDLPSADKWAIVFSTTLLLIVLVQFFFYQKGRQHMSPFGLAKYDHKEWNKPVIGLWVSSTIMIGAPSMSVIIVESYVGPEEAGPFFSALRTAQLLNLLLIASTVICSPMLAKALAKGDLKEAQQTASISALISGIFAIIGFLFFVSFGKPMLNIFGAGFDTSYFALLILSTGFLVNAMAGPTGPLLEMSGHEKVYSYFLLFFNGLAILSMPLTIEFWGALGGAVSISFAAIGWNIAAWIYCRLKVGVDPTIFSLLLPCKTHKDNFP